MKYNLFENNHSARPGDKIWIAVEVVAIADDGEAQVKLLNPARYTPKLLEEPTDEAAD